MGLAAPAMAGGPLFICDSGQPFLWPGSGANIPWNPDQGDLGPLTHAQAVAEVGANCCQDWRWLAMLLVLVLPLRAWLFVNTEVAARDSIGFIRYALQLENNVTIKGKTLGLTGTGFKGKGALENLNANNTWQGPIILIGDATIADGILDRLVHNAHRIELRGESLRKTRAKKPETKSET